MEKGICYVTEASVALLLLALVIIGSSAQAQEKPGEKMDDLYITQALHDVLKCRFVERNLSLPAMERDFRRLFPGKSGFVELNGARISIGEKGREAISSSAVFYSPGLERNEFAVLVYLD